MSRVYYPTTETAPGDLGLRSLLGSTESRRARRPGQTAAATPLPRRLTAAPGTVASVDRIGPDLVRLTVAKPPGFDYAPGQSTRLELDGMRRRYTIVSAPHEPQLEFFIEVVPGGRLSPRLAALRPGVRIGVGAGGRKGLTLDLNKTRHLMLATVTGVNPFVSILRDAEHRGRRNLGCVLVHGASHADEFGYDAELRALAAERPDLLTYIPTVSRPGEARNAGWAGARGRADARIESVLAQHSLSPANTAAYACGNPGMVEASRQRLGALGFTVRAEKYA